MGIQKWTFSVMGPVLWNGILGSHLDDIQKAITELFPRLCIYTAGWDFWLDVAFLATHDFFVSFVIFLLINSEQRGWELTRV